MGRECGESERARGGGGREGEREREVRERERERDGGREGGRERQPSRHHSAYCVALQLIAAYCGRYLSGVGGGEAASQGGDGGGVREDALREPQQLAEHCI